ncbi:DUF2155 domain-containing protein [Ruegeria pomeroyi]|uniref:DUF2155 domain-containing protein n=1 Tax=Ruegeria pomeroyi TaxID=89184 RepID=A0A9Q3ZMP1_9RHOB|nr:DUF2155 domain-containing protein [Ruegeria pomeroyi]MCE8521958.1 DUF2155 domain-containing protein [Ruegeria pomeroyi]MCE8526226.1 DUF2155 domain-containing protein [Ruegeria pomeroyi]MCE8534577.1 DUF2155 domain-containing protein [Ruegeria pomeroyi]MCE8536804.1 DUF2155 domain-containing protein [Ruegeria pomeroyi]
MIRLAALILTLLAAPVLASDQVTSGAGALLRGLDKVSGQTEDFRVGNGETAEIYGLDVALGDCRYPVENPTGDAFAYLTIWEHGQRQAIFDGWMIASSPALSALDHSRYDVWVIRCMTP